jgi:acetylornithine/succinyldiaminopimelate/putrescine aminotransferase
LSKKHQILIVVDEIQTGLLRSGKYFAYQLFNLEPDIVTLAKAIGGGLPLGATLVNEKLQDVLSYGEHGSTFGGNPLACALGNVVLDEIMHTDFQETLITNACELFKLLSDMKELYPTIIKDVRGYGFMLGVEIESSIIEEIKQAFMNHHILVNVTNQNVLRLLPPLNIERKDLLHFIEIFKTILKSYKQ